MQQDLKILMMRMEIQLIHLVTSDVQALVAFESSKNPDATRLEDFDDENGDSSDLDNICSSDEIIFVKGQVFSSAELIRTFLREFALQQRKNIYVKKSERKKVVVKCSEGCKFYMRFSKAPPKTYFVLTTY